MAMIPSPVGTDIHPYILTDEDHRCIGVVICACAELENILDHFLTEVSGILRGQLMVLLGRASTATKLRVAQRLAVVRGEHWPTLYHESFEHPTYRGLIKFRNSVAHGWLLGLTDAGQIAFEILEPTEDVEVVITTVSAYPPEALAEYATVSLQVVRILEERLGARASREARRALPLHPHRKAKNQGRPQAKRERPPEPSQG
jgi:hypothetical protein